MSPSTITGIHHISEEGLEGKSCIDYDLNYIHAKFEVNRLVVWASLNSKHTAFHFLGSKVYYYDAHDVTLTRH